MQLVSVLQYLRGFVAGGMVGFAESTPERKKSGFAGQRVSTVEDRGL